MYNTDIMVSIKLYTHKIREQTSVEVLSLFQVSSKENAEGSYFAPRQRFYIWYINKIAAY